MQGMLEDIETIIYWEKCRKEELSDPYGGINLRWRHCRDLMKILDEKDENYDKDADLIIKISIKREKNKYAISWVEICSEENSYWSNMIGLPDLEIYESEILKTFRHCSESYIGMIFINHDREPVNMIKRLIQKTNSIIDVVSDLI